MIRQAKRRPQSDLRSMRVPPEFATEADLCAAFIGAVPAPWTCYAETSGWDILAVDGTDGRQVGIEAKLKLNAKVLVQALESDRSAWGGEGPDYRAILVPQIDAGEIAALAAYAGVTVIRANSFGRFGASFWPDMPLASYRWSNEDWHEWMPTKRCWIPEYVPDVTAGASAPTKLTDWKIRALRVAALLHDAEIITRADFKRIGIDIRRWITAQWIEPAPGGYRRGRLWPGFESQHPEVWPQVVADRDKWAAPTSIV